MPALSNPRHEMFARELAKGKTADEAYEAAGLQAKPFGGQSDYYVYALIDPTNGRLFYIGKGKGKRALVHWSQMFSDKCRSTAKSERLIAIKRAGLKVRVDILADGLTNDSAYLVEQSFIRLIGFTYLTNVLPGSMTENMRLLREARHMMKNAVSFMIWRRENPEKPERLHWDYLARLYEIEGILDRAVNGPTPHI